MSYICNNGCLCWLCSVKYKTLCTLHIIRCVDYIFCMLHIIYLCEHPFEQLYISFMIVFLNVQFSRTICLSNTCNTMCLRGTWILIQDEGMTVFDDSFSDVFYTTFPTVLTLTQHDMVLVKTTFHEWASVMNNDYTFFILFILWYSSSPQ